MRSLAQPLAAVRTGSLAAPMRLSAVLGALSRDFDRAQGQPDGHGQRGAWIALHIGRQLELNDAVLGDLLYIALLKHAGGGAAARLGQLCGEAGRRAARTLDWHCLRQRAGFLLRHAGAGETPMRRLARMAVLAWHGDRLEAELVRARCGRGAAIARRLGLGERVAQAIYSLDEHWNGRGHTEGLRGEAIPLGARIALLAQIVAAFHETAGREAALAEAARRAGSWFDPRMVAALQAASLEPGFWDGLAGEDIAERLAAVEPAGRVVSGEERRRIVGVVAEGREEDFFF